MPADTTDIIAENTGDELSDVATKTRVVFCWHMHQPDYRDVLTGEYYFPWTYLHAMKDYVDMIGHLENHPKARAVFNFAPILLEQLEDYSQQINAYLDHEEELRDPMLAALVADYLPLAGTPEFQDLAQKCLRANRQRIIERFPAYTALADTVTLLEEKAGGLRYLSDQFLIDLLVWHHLGWLGETVRREHPRVKFLQEKAEDYSPDDRYELLRIIGEQLNSLGPRYRALAERGQIEISTSPYAHPIIPLLLDFKSAQQAMPDVELPAAPLYPGGAQRARWHMAQGILTFERFFGFHPQGCWASEGSLSDATLHLLDDFQFSWTATGDSVLHHSLGDAENKTASKSHKQDALENESHRVYQFNGAAVNCFFRDDGLSDLIGFEYANWHADDAVNDLIHHMENIANASKSTEDSVISIIMDGENAWEHFPENAWYFLDALYARLEDHPQLELATYSDVLEQRKPTPVVLPHLVAGSWVYGTFSTWIGDRDKNLGWDMLCAAKREVDKVIASRELSDAQLEQVEKQLALCEGSDWFWWFGDYNPAASVQDFEYLFRRHLMNLYSLIDQPAPEYLAHSVSKGSGSPAQGGVMRHGHAEGESR